MKLTGDLLHCCKHCGTHPRAKISILLRLNVGLISFHTKLKKHISVKVEDSLHSRLEFENTSQNGVSQLSLSHFTTSPSVHLSDVTSCSLRSRPHSRNRDNLPTRAGNVIPLTTLRDAPRVSVPLGDSLREREGVSTL